jgi:signal transduction histidine kinase
MDSLPTHFAPAERDPLPVLRQQRDRVLAHELLRRLVEVLPDAVLILNRHRQIIYANRMACAMLAAGPDALLAMRPGEALGCTHACDEDGGCGTTRFCGVCGAVRAILDGQRNQRAETQECRINRVVNGVETALDLRVWSIPLGEIGDSVMMFIMRDISAQQRRELLERIFFHDVINAAGALQALLDLTVQDAEPGSLPEHVILAHEVGRDMLDQIEAARDLALAEGGRLEPRLERFDVTPLLMRLCDNYRSHLLGADKHLPGPSVTGDPVITTAPQLLNQVMTNLLRNALEASEPGGTVTVSFRNQGEAVFEVHNDTTMSESVRLQIFQRSFSTRQGSGRGVGTYSVKLITERYLHGSVSFSSAPGQGTTFTIRLPQSGG